MPANEPLPPKELHRKYRPRRLEDLVGQPELVAKISSWFAKEPNTVPQSMIIHGYSGCGKTSAAKIIARMLGCQRHDFRELDSAQFRGIDTVREIRRDLGRHTLVKSGIKFWFMDEAHQLTKDAQFAALKMFEEPAPGAYFVLATTEFEKIIKELRGRCAKLAVRSLKEDELIDLARSVLKQEGLKFSDDVLRQAAAMANGSARNILSELNAVRDLKTDTERLAALQPEGTRKTAADIFLELVYKKPPRWDVLRSAIEGIADENWEGIRQAVLTVASKELLKPNGRYQQAYYVLCAFEKDWFYTKRAGLIAACFEAVAKISK